MSPPTAPTSYPVNTQYRLGQPGPRSRRRLTRQPLRNSTHRPPESPPSPDRQLRHHRFRSTRPWYPPTVHTPATAHHTATPRSDHTSPQHPEQKNSTHQPPASNTQSWSAYYPRHIVATPPSPHQQHSPPPADDSLPHPQPTPSLAQRNHSPRQPSPPPEYECRSEHRYPYLPTTQSPSCHPHQQPHSARNHPH